MISGHKDTDLIILSKMDDETLFSFCKIENSYVQKLCKDEIFWRARVKEKFGNVKKNEDRTWKNLYLNIVYYREKYGIYKSSILFVNEDKKDRDLDLLDFFEYEVLKRIENVLIEMLRENLTAHIFSKKESDEFIKKHHDNIKEASNDIFYVWNNYLEKIEIDPSFLREDLYNHVPREEIVSKNLA